MGTGPAVTCGESVGPALCASVVGSAEVVAAVGSAEVAAAVGLVLLSGELWLELTDTEDTSGDVDAGTEGDEAGA